MDLLESQLDTLLEEDQILEVLWSKACDFLRQIMMGSEICECNGELTEIPAVVIGYKKSLMAYQAINLLSYLQIIKQATLQGVKDFIELGSHSGNKALTAIWIITSSNSD